MSTDQTLKTKPFYFKGFHGDTTIRIVDLNNTHALLQCEYKIANKPVVKTVYVNHQVSYLKWVNDVYFLTTHWYDHEEVGWFLENFLEWFSEQLSDNGIEVNHHFYSVGYINTKAGPIAYSVYPNRQSIVLVKPCAEYQQTWGINQLTLSLNTTIESDSLSYLINNWLSTVSPELNSHVHCQVINLLDTLNKRNELHLL